MVNIVPYGAVLTSHIGFRGTRGFSVVITEDTGQMSAAVVAPDGAFVISGACTTFTAASQRLDAGLDRRGRHRRPRQ